MQPALDGLTESGFSRAAHLRQWVRVTLPTLSLAGHDEVKANTDAMRFRDAWAGAVLHDEHAECSDTDNVSERRERNEGL